MREREVVISTLEHTSAAFIWALTLELAHLRLHYLDGVLKPDLEHHRRAERYATVFLMPEDQVRKAVVAKASLQELSEIFGVPIEIARLRVTELGLKAREKRWGSGRAKKQPKAASTEI